MIIECPFCESNVDGIVLSELENYDQVNGIQFKDVFLKCPVCKNALVGGCEEVQVGPEKFIWSKLIRQWPQQETTVPFEIPPIARNSLIEARICFKAKAFSACAVMSGRTLEGVCVHHKTKSKNIASGLRELKDKGIIDKKLYEWGEEIRKHRNIGAHATEEKIPKEDAKDLLDFAQVICEYVFILNAKFERFKERKKKFQMRTTSKLSTKK